MTDRPMEPLGPLLGTWESEIVAPATPDRVLKGRMMVDWIEAGAFARVRQSCEPGGPPASVAIIGRDAANDSWSCLYSDARGVARLYGMAFHDDLWALERHGDPFPQRFVCKLLPDGRTMEARWERADEGGRDFALDFTITYRKAE